MNVPIHFVRCFSLTVTVPILLLLAMMLLAPF